MTTPAQICPHLQHADLEVLLVLNQQIFLTAGIVRCKRCYQHYLVELAYTEGQRQLLRVSVLDSDIAQHTLTSLQKGSCDVSRAGAETLHLRNSAQLTEVLLTMRNGVFEGLAAPPANAG